MTIRLHTECWAVAEVVDIVVSKKGSFGSNVRVTACTHSTYIKCTITSECDIIVDCVVLASVTSLFFFGMFSFCHAYSKTGEKEAFMKMSNARFFFIFFLALQLGGFICSTGVAK